ncbi:unnamed protein product [Brassicogethes aeneus]|uniref:Uncharacterized protein n=1 Tax=Brassicogethes aeneus TaxID=1431903 RepID=A0A9P0B233_BRAAE|nr:unnamed protein product [Brassicogethes aeneus]
MATQEDRSLSSGVSFPKWMKSKINDKFDLDQSTFSPTELDDSFMYYFRHPQASAERRGSGQKIISSTGGGTNITVTNVTKNNSKQDFSKHPPPCQKFMQNSDGLSLNVTSDGKVKPNGIDDGFKGEAAKCGSSILRVAQQMVSGKVISNFTLAHGEDCDPDLKHFDPQKRRGSRSLPASPLQSPNSSPKSRRRVNKFFTSAYADIDQTKGSWILSNLMARRTMSQTFIGEESKEELDKASSISTSTLNVDEIPANNNNKPNLVYKAKPSELREMNFWSPTSM